MAAYDFEDGSGTKAIDRTGNGNDLTLSGAEFGPGKRGGGLALSPTGPVADTAQTAGPVARTEGDYTISAWIRSGDPDANMSAISQDGGTVSAFALGMYQVMDVIKRPMGGRYGFGVRSADAPFSGSARAINQYDDTRSKVQAGRWYHVVGVRDQREGSINYYLDGKSYESDRFEGGFASTGPLVLGRSRDLGQAVEPFNGSLDDVRVYNRALSAGEVAQLYDVGG